MSEENIVLEPTQELVTFAIAKAHGKISREIYTAGLASITFEVFGKFSPVEVLGQVLDALASCPRNVLAGEFAVNVTEKENGETMVHLDLSERH